MKGKRILSVVFVLCMLIQLLPVVSVYADATTWQYQIQIRVANEKNAEAKKQSKAISTVLHFSGGDENFSFSGADKKDNLLTSENPAWVSTTKAPWTLSSFTVKNACSDGFKFYSLCVYYKKGNGESQTLIEYYPGGKNDNRTGGKWVGGKNNDSVQKIDIGAPKRAISSTGAFSSLSKDIHIADNTASGSVVWDGKITDQYGSYVSWDESDAPVLKIDVVRGEGKGSSSVTVNQLGDYGFSLSDDGKGYEYDASKLRSKMASDGVMRFEVDLKLEFPSSSTVSTDGKNVYKASVKFTRDLFTLADESGVVFSGKSNGFSGNWYFYDSDTKKINVDAYIKTNANYSHLDGMFKGKSLEFDRAYLKTKGADGKDIILDEEQATGSKKSGKITVTDSIKLSFSFDYDVSGGIDSANNGTYFILENARITGADGATYSLWDEDAGKSGYSYYASTYKIDSKAPTFAINPSSGTNLNNWNKYVKLDVKPDEDIYREVKTYKTYEFGRIKRVTTREKQEAYLSISGTGENNLNVTPTIYRYTYNPESANDNGSASASKSSLQSMAAVKGKNETVTVALAEAIEGEFELVITGEDVAGNEITAKYPGIKLDNAPPQIALEQVKGTKKDSNNMLKNEFKFTINDLSGTGRVYYMFTQKSFAEAKKIPLNGSTGEGADDEGNDIKSLLGKWAEIKQSDNSQTAVLQIADGEDFKGRIIYYAVDDCGNQTEIKSEEIEMHNESAAMTIAPTSVSVPKPSYNIYIESEGNKISYNWKKLVKDEVTGKSEYKYVFDSFKEYKNVIDTDNDSATKGLNGAYTLEVKVVTPSGMGTSVKSENYYFDNVGPEIDFVLPSKTSYLSGQTVTVYVRDAASNNSYVYPNSAKARIVSPDGKAIDGSAEILLPVNDGEVNYSMAINNMKSGAYALEVSAADANGTTSSETSEAFYVRSGKPDGNVEMQSDTKVGDIPVVTGGMPINLSFDMKEEFVNAKYAGEQILYYRLASAADEYGDWQPIGTMSKSDNGFTAKNVISVPSIPMTDGENKLFVQTTICPSEADINQTAISCVKEDVITFLYDETPPKAYLVIDDIHTKGNISGMIQASDDTSGVLNATCDDENVEIGGYTNGAFNITVKKNVNTTVSIYDKAKNKREIPLIIKGIDLEAPTAEITVKTQTTGDRQDVTATVTVSNMAETAETTAASISSKAPEETMFALIPTEEYKGGEIPDKYFKENLSGNMIFNVTKTRSDNGIWEGETANTYKVELAGVTGSYYLGVRASDSLGNTSDIVFNDTGEVLTVSYKTLTVNYSIKPAPEENREVTRAVVTAQFNMPVYVLPQSKATGATDDENFDIAEENASNYTDTASFVASSHGDYVLYTIDDLGRTEKFTKTIDENDVKLAETGDVTATICKLEWKEATTPEGVKYDEKVYEPIGVGEKICAVSPESYYLIITSDKENTLLLPMESDMNDNQSPEHGFVFDFTESGSYGIDKDGNKVENIYDRESVKGYTTLVYQIRCIEGVFDGWRAVSADVEDRVIDVRTFHVSDDPTDETAVDVKTLVVSNIDNTEPKVSWSVSPEVLVYGTFDEGGDGIEYGTVAKPTPGNVTYTLSAQDAESGINTKDIIALEYSVSVGEGENQDWVQVKITPNEMNDDDNEDIKGTYRKWDGHNKDIPISYFDTSIGEYVETTVKIPVIIEYFGDDDIYGVKTLKYTFTDEFDLNRNNGLGAGIFVNTLGGQGEAFIEYQGSEGGLTSKGLIYKMPIEEGVDYKIVYKTENGDVIENVESGYYNNVTAEIEILARGEERGLYTANNGGALSHNLNVYQRSFGFKLKDKYGYSADAEAEIKNFDITPGVLDYTVSNTVKTNKPITVTVTASDSESGVGKVIFNGTEEVELTSSGDGKYTGKITISKNGTYNIVMYDKSGNKTTKNFHIMNYNDEVPTATVYYACGATSWTNTVPDNFYTARPVTATLSFSKENVKITEVETKGGLTAKDYTVNYNSSVITFTKSGTLEVAFTDDYGNEGREIVSVSVIDTTPPNVEPILETGSDLSSVKVEFNKKTDMGSLMDVNRRESDMFVSYGGITKTVANEDGSKNSFTFYENGTYTFKVYDKEGLLTRVDVTIDGVDKNAPKITEVKWSYGYEVYENGKWVEETVSKTITPTEGSMGYRIATNDNPVTNRDVTVSVITDMPTRLTGSNDAYNTIQERDYDKNGFFIFNTEKQNGLLTSYGVDVEVIDKTPPIIDLMGTSEMIFYENSAMMQEPYNKDMLKYRAYDIFNGVETNLTDSVEIDWGGFNADDLNANTFDSSKPYTVTYKVSDNAHNITEVRRTIRLVGLYDTIVTVNGKLPDSTGKSTISGDKVALALKNFSGTAYVRYQKGSKTMGQMKKDGIMLTADENGEYTLSGLTDGWYTFYVQTDKRDYFTLGVYVAN